MSDLDDIARAIFTKAIATNRAGELLCCLFDGGSATIDHATGALIIVQPSQLASIGVPAPIGVGGCDINLTGRP